MYDFQFFFGTKSSFKDTTSVFYFFLNYIEVVFTVHDFVRFCLFFNVQMESYDVNKIFDFI